MIARPPGLLSEHVLEIRFEPRAAILDRRGEWAESLAKGLGLKHWQIIENRLDVFDQGRNPRAFVSFRNMGCILQDPRGPEEHRNLAKKFVRLAMGLSGFPNRIGVKRFGVRGRFCVPFHGSFEELRDQYLATYAAPTNMLLAALGEGVTIEDVGAPLHFSDDVGRFNTQCGPMPEHQLAEFFKNRDALPEVALYYDVDYWSDPNSEQERRDLLPLIDQYSKRVWERFRQVREVVLDSVIPSHAQS